jgi:hypothetical protein
LRETEKSVFFFSPCDIRANRDNRWLSLNAPEKAVEGGNFSGALTRPPLARCRFFFAAAATLPQIAPASGFTLHFGQPRSLKAFETSWRRGLVKRRGIG